VVHQHWVVSPWPTRLERAEIAALYERYLACCNEHRFDQLGEFVSEQVSGSGAADGLPGYIDRLKTVHTAFPDYRWELQELVVEQDTIAARLIGQGTHTGPFDGIAATGRRIRTQELVIYRFADGKIVQCWGDLFPVVRDAMTAPADAET
jgi:predicted ester cyclase